MRPTRRACPGSHEAKTSKKPLKAKHSRTLLAENQQIDTLNISRQSSVPYGLTNSLLCILVLPDHGHTILPWYLAAEKGQILLECTFRFLGHQCPLELVFPCTPAKIFQIEPISFEGLWNPLAIPSLSGTSLPSFRSA